jgi:hypothetical protein
MDADRQVEKMLTEEQRKALAEKLRMHEEAGMTPAKPKKPEFWPKPKPKDKYI